MYLAIERQLGGEERSSVRGRKRERDQKRRLKNKPDDILHVPLESQLSRYSVRKKVFSFPHKVSLEPVVVTICEIIIGTCEADKSRLKRKLYPE